MLELAVVILMAPFLFAQDWAQHINNRIPLEAEQMRASHGFALMLLLPYYASKAEASVKGVLPWNWHPYYWPAILAMAAFGVYWLIIGWSRSRSVFRDARLSTRAITKIAVGAAVYVLGVPAVKDLWNSPDLDSSLVGIAVLVSQWCVVTGGLKLIMNLRGAPQMRGHEEVGEMPQGDADFGEWRRRD